MLRGAHVVKNLHEQHVLIGRRTSGYRARLAPIRLLYISRNSYVYFALWREAYHAMSFGQEDVERNGAQVPGQHHQECENQSKNCQLHVLVPNAGRSGALAW